MREYTGMITFVLISIAALFTDNTEMGLFAIVLMLGIIYLKMPDDK